MADVLKTAADEWRAAVVVGLTQVTHPTTKEPTWYRISIPGRPNGKTGWIPAGSVELRSMEKRLFVDRSERRFEFWDGDRLVRRGKVAVGAPGAETSTGLWGGGVVGVHGTPGPWLLGKNVSHGCMRLHKDDVRWLRARMPVGTPIKIVH